MIDRKGKMFPEYWVCCAKCGDERDTGETTTERAAQSMRVRGWTRKTDGWHCEGCT